LGVFFFAADAVSLQFLTHNSTVLRLGTLSFRWILKCRQNIRWVTTPESLFQTYVSTAKARCSTDQHTIATEMFWVSLEGRSRTNFPRPWFLSQLCCKIVRYFCRTLYVLIIYWIILISNLFYFTYYFTAYYFSYNILNMNARSRNWQHYYQIYILPS